MSSARELRDHVLYLLQGGGAHLSFENLVKDFPPELCNQQISGLPYTPWQVLEHMRLAQWDILEFSRDADHVSPDSPDGYWPRHERLGSPEEWAETVAKFRHDLQEMVELVASPATDLLAKIPHGDGQTILREALLTADHNAYHLGALAVMSRLVNG